MEVEKGNLNDVKKLLKGGANINGSGALEMRPLISAARAGNATMLKLLISFGANLEVEARRPHGARAVHAAISGERLDALCVLLEAGVDYDARDGDGQTPLMLTSLASTAAAMAEELLRVGADPKKKNNEGMSSLHVAAGLNNTQVMFCLSPSTAVKKHALCSCSSHVFLSTKHSLVLRISHDILL